MRSVSSGRRWSLCVLRRHRCRRRRLLPLSSASRNPEEKEWSERGTRTIGRTVKPPENSSSGNLEVTKDDDLKSLDDSVIDFASTKAISVEMARACASDSYRQQNFYFRH